MLFLAATIGGLVSGAKSISRQISKVVGEANEAVRQRLLQLENSLNALVEDLSQTYQENLGITLDSLDDATSNKLLELQSVLNRIQTEVIGNIQNAAEGLIDQISMQIQDIAIDLEKRVKNIIVVGGETAVYVLDRAMYNLILVISLILLGVGMFGFIWFLFKEGAPEGLTRILVFSLMGAYLLVFGSLAIVPKVRAWVMKFTGVGLKARLDKVVDQKPRILYLFPDDILVGETDELEIIGESLLPDGKQPKVTIADKEISIKASAEDHLVVDLNGFTAPRGSAAIKLNYDDGEDETSAIVRIRHKEPPKTADLMITRFILNPILPIKNRNTEAKIIVKNQGNKDVGKFTVRWDYHSGNPGKPSVVPGLKAGKSTTVSLHHTYKKSGKFDTLARIDVHGDVDETNETNNVEVRRVTVLEPTVPLYRWWRPGNNFYTIKKNALSPGQWGYAYLGVPCYVYSEKRDKTVGLHRYYHSGIDDHFYTTDKSELGGGGGGWIYEGIECYVFPKQERSTVPLHRYWHSVGGDHYYTINWNELRNGANGYAYEGVACYVRKDPE